MENIICDTNIWYDIAKGKIKPAEISKLRLIGTAVNIIEISSTPNIIKNIELFRQTITVLNKYHDIIICTNPIEHLISIFDKSFESNDEYVNNLLDDFVAFQSINPLRHLSQKECDIVRNSIAKNIANKDKITKVVNVLLPKTRSYIKENHLKKKHKFNSQKDSWKHFFSLLLSQYYKDNYRKELTIDIEDTKWELLELFITAWEIYFISIEIQQCQKFKNNDWHDLFNLVYVQPGFKFWTNEGKSWAKLIKENVVLRPFIFRNN